MTGSFGELSSLKGTEVEAGGRCGGEDGREAEAVRNGVLSIERLDAKERA